MTEKKPWRVRLRGPLGKALEKFASSRLVSADFDRLLDPYRYKTGLCCGKDVLLWGQAMVCAIRALPYLEEPGELDEKIRRSAAQLMELQETTDRITAFPEGRELQGWDLAGRRYVLKALLLAYTMSGAEKERIRECCVRICDQILELVGPGKRSILHCGVLGGLDSSALTDVFSQVYRLSGHGRFLEFARYIIKSGCSQQHDIFYAFSRGMAPAMLGNGSAAGLTDCFRGLAEIANCAAEYSRPGRELCRQYMERIVAEELFITGSGGGGSEAGDRWCGGALHQSGGLGGMPMGNTGVTAACIEFFNAMTILEKPWHVYALAERSFYNALLGTWDADRCLWALNDPVFSENSRRKPAAAEGALYDHLRGAEALTLAPSMAFVPMERGGILNFYEEMEAHLSRKTLIRVTGGYPGSSKAHISIRSRKPFRISMRIPEYCTGVYYCDCLLRWKKNSYLTIDRPWEPDEVLTLEFDPAIRTVPAPDGSPLQAFIREPLVLAVDQRGAEVPDAMGEICHNKLSWVDFASAGKPFGSDQYFNVWFRKLIPDYLKGYFGYD